ncbi:haloacid dehalogenase [Diplodia corticola]|uniref:Haloacid dehalogenase n=1 Tax=Diplodia corticola TaxID=236234 RepID=A0A1J9RRX3_9PEZI|nr:haloacid dehalogenase [Diplodia corticola]OJD30277.1 haloacid dehalogenase [Diplodia corticola]
MSAPSTSPPRPKAIIFDLLTALLDSWTAWTLALSTALNEPEPTTPTHDLATHWRHTYLALTYTHKGPYTPYAALVHLAAQQTPGVPPRAAEVLLENYVAWLAPWPEARAVLGRLRREGYAVGVATNCSEVLGRGAAGVLEDGCGTTATMKTARSEGLGREEGEEEDGDEREGRGGGSAGFVFDAVVTAEESGWYKPAPGAYAAVLDRLGCRADEVVFVAGSAADVPGARGAGIERVVWHNRVGMEAKPGAEGLAEKEGATLWEVLEGVVL